MKIWYKIASHNFLSMRPLQNMNKQHSAACFTAGMATIVGGRDSQQDHYQLISTDANGHRTIYKASNCPNITQEGSTIVAALTDGVGGQVAGDIAALLAAESFTESIDSSLSSDDVETKTRMMDAVYDANLALEIAIKSNKSYAGMATTLVGVILNEKGLNWLSVGDSHLYLIRDGELSKLNADHSMGALIDHDYSIGKISHEEAMNAPYRNVILSCLSGKKIEIIDIYDDDWELRSGDKLILASDGLDTLSRDEILATIMQQTTPQSSAEALIHAVEQKQREYQDNTTLIVIYYL